MNERLSAWMDGELEGEKARQLISQLKPDVDFRGNWNCYHLIGDALRGVHGPDLCARICARLDAEPTMRGPQYPAWRQKLGRFASTAGARVTAVVVLAFVGWMTLPILQHHSPPVATLPAPEVKQAASPAGEDARGYLLAHQHYSPRNALQGLAVYVRPISQESPLRAGPVIK